VLRERVMPGAHWFPVPRSTTPSMRCAPGMARATTTRLSCSAGRTG
jgi:hypothetical protein